MSEIAEMAATRQTNPLWFWLATEHTTRIFEGRTGVAVKPDIRKQRKQDKTYAVIINAKSKYSPKNGILAKYTNPVPTILTTIIQCHVVTSNATMQSSFKIKTVKLTLTIFGPSTCVSI